ncbi:MAG: hypothetical protein M3526_00380 [Actinomycetota bacterium]|nr:hypothetical protein [Actinomycetota bacterium]
MGRSQAGLVGHRGGLGCGKRLVGLIEVLGHSSPAIADIRGFSTFTRERGDQAAAGLATRFAAAAPLEDEDTI